MSDLPNPQNTPPPPGDNETSTGPSFRIVAGFWEKAGAWTLPRDARGEGYADVLRKRKVEIGFCTLFVFASGWGQTFLISLFQPHWRTELGLSAAAMGTIYGVATLISGLLLPLAGRWLDRTSSDRAAGVALAGLIIGSLLAAAAINPWMLGLALFTLRYFGQGMSANVGITRAARWFTHNRGKAVSLAGLGFPLGEALLPITVTLLIAGFGWRWAWVALAAICTVILAPAAFALIVRRRANHGRSQAPRAGIAPPRADRRSVLGDWRFYAMLAVNAPLPFISTGIIFFQGTIAETRNWNPALFPTGFMLFAVARALFALSAGAWIDKIGSLKVLAVPTTIFAIGLIILAQPSPAFAYVFFVLLGISFGTSSGVTTTAWTDLFGSHRIGLIKGLSGSVAVVSTAVAPIVFGLAFEAGITLNAILFGSAVCMIILSWPMCILLARSKI